MSAQGAAPEGRDLGAAGSAGERQVYHVGEWAQRYVSRLRLALVPLHGKAPYRDGWQLNENLIRDPAAARAHWSAHPADGIGACLEPSGLVSLDCDDLGAAREVLGAEGIDLERLIEKTPTIVGRSPRLEFRAPQRAAIAVEMLPALKEEAKKRQEAGVNQYSSLPPKAGEASKHSGEAVVQAAKIVGVGKTLGRKSITWPARTTGEKPVTVLELRAGRCQDVLPPSIHPDTGRPYRWLTPPREGFPELPEALLNLWLDFDSFRHRARNLCPWADPEPEQEKTVAHRDYLSRPLIGPSVIAAFNEAHEAAAILEAHGYERAGRRRWKSPNGHGVAGIVLLLSGKVYSHHQSDPLGDGHAHDAFDVFAALEHGGDVRAAVREAARLLDMNRRSAA